MVTLVALINEDAEDGNDTGAGERIISCTS